jgi:3-oxoacyl-[acyl-carrier-protein] synthase-3
VPPPVCLIVGWGKCVPDKVVTNQELARTLNTSDEWIRDRTGIRERRVAAAGDTTATLAVRAARDALNEADLPAAQLDLVIVSTVTPDYPVPATASLVQDALGAGRAGAFDLAAGCSGFVYALAVASGMIRAGACRTILVVGADTMSRVTDWSDRNTCVLLGDGAGAFVLQAGPPTADASSTEGRQAGSADRRPSGGPGGVLSSWLGSDGSGSALLTIPAGGSRSPASPATVGAGLHYLKMNGRAVYRFATDILGRAVAEAVVRAGLRLDDIDLVIPHQANLHIIESAAGSLGMPAGKFFVNLAAYGNTSNASVPIAACDAVAEGRLRPGDRVVLVAFGAGLSWGAMTVEWGRAGRATDRHGEVRQAGLSAEAGAVGEGQVTRGRGTRRA